MPLITHSALRQIPDDAKEFFIFTTPVAGVVSAATVGDVQTTTIRITQEAHFVAIKLVYDESVATTACNFFIQIEPSEGDRRLQNDWVRADNYFGTAQLPMIMPQPRLFLANTVVTIRIRNNEANARTTFFSMIGFKIFYDLNQLDLTRRVM